MSPVQHARNYRQSPRSNVMAGRGSSNHTRANTCQSKPSTGILQQKMHPKVASPSKCSSSTTGERDSVLPSVPMTLADRRGFEDSVGCNILPYSCYFASVQELLGHQPSLPQPWMDTLHSLRYGMPELTLNLEDIETLLKRLREGPEKDYMRTMALAKLDTYVRAGMARLECNDWTEPTWITAFDKLRRHSRVHQPIGEIHIDADGNDIVGDRWSGSNIVSRSNVAVTTLDGRAITLGASPPSRLRCDLFYRDPQAHVEAYYQAVVREDKGSHETRAPNELERAVWKSGREPHNLERDESHKIIPFHGQLEFVEVLKYGLSKSLPPEYRVRVAGKWVSESCIKPITQFFVANDEIRSLTGRHPLTTFCEAYGSTEACDIERLRAQRERNEARYKGKKLGHPVPVKLPTCSKTEETAAPILRSQFCMTKVKAKRVVDGKTRTMTVTVVRKVKPVPIRACGYVSRERLPTIVEDSLCKPSPAIKFDCGVVVRRISLLDFSRQSSGTIREPEGQKMRRRAAEQRAKTKANLHTEGEAIARANPREVKGTKPDAQGETKPQGRIKAEDQTQSAVNDKVRASESKGAKKAVHESWKPSYWKIVETAPKVKPAHATGNERPREASEAPNGAKAPTGGRTAAADMTGRTKEHASQGSGQSQVSSPPAQGARLPIRVASVPLRTANFSAPGLNPSAQGATRFVPERTLSADVAWPPIQTASLQKHVPNSRVHTSEVFRPFDVPPEPTGQEIERPNEELRQMFRDRGRRASERSEDGVGVSMADVEMMPWRRTPGAERRRSEFQELVAQSEYKPKVAARRNLDPEVGRQLAELEREELERPAGWTYKSCTDLAVGTVTLAAPAARQRPPQFISLEEPRASLAQAREELRNGQAGQDRRREEMAASARRNGFPNDRFGIGRPASPWNRQ